MTATVFKPRRGTAAQQAAFTGAAEEFTRETDTGRLITHDGSTVGGKFKTGGEVLSKTADYTVALEDFHKLIAVDTSQQGSPSANITITLPTVPPNGYRVGVKKTDAGSDSVVVSDGSASPTPNIDGSATYSLSSQYDCAWFEFDGTTWHVVATKGIAGSSGDAWSDPVDADVIPDADGTRDLGSTAKRFAEVHTDTLEMAGTSTSAIREVLTADRTYYVRSDGNDSNTGLANNSGGAFATIQKAYDVITASLDLGGYTVNIEIVDTAGGGTTYTAGLLIEQPWTGGGSVVVKGDNAAAPDDVILSVASGDAIRVTSQLGGALVVQDIKLVAASGRCIRHEGLGVIEWSNVEFGSASSHINAVVTGAVCRCTGDYEISGSAAMHLISAGGGYIDMLMTPSTSATVTLTGTPAWSSYFALATEHSRMKIHSSRITFSGSATGARYYVDKVSLIDTAGGGASYLPGNSAGSTATGGQYT